MKHLQTAQSASKALKMQDRVKPDKAKRSRFSRGVCTRRLFHRICFYSSSPGGGTGRLDLELAACWEEPALEAPGVRFSCCCFPNATKTKSTATNPTILTVTPSPTVSELRCSSKKRLPRMELAVQMSHVSPAEDPKSKKIPKANDSQSKRFQKILGGPSLHRFHMLIRNWKAFPSRASLKTADLTCQKLGKTRILCHLTFFFPPVQAAS